MAIVTHSQYFARPNIGQQCWHCEDVHYRGVRANTMVWHFSLDAFGRCLQNYHITLASNCYVGDTLCQLTIPL